jgi:uncharacterized protein YukE
VTGRPIGWAVLGLSSDPTPGDAEETRLLAVRLRAFAQDVSEALNALNGLDGDEALRGWVGQAGAAFQQNYGDLPSQLPKLYNSYDMAASAMEAYWPQLSDAQTQADHALATGLQNPHDPGILATARQQAVAAGELLEQAASIAAKAVAQASAAGIANLNWIQRMAGDIGGFLGDVRTIADIVSRIADDVAPVLEILGAVALVIPGGEVIGAGLELAAQDTEIVGKAAEYVSGYSSMGIAGADLVQGDTHEAVANYEQGKQTLHDAHGGDSDGPKDDEDGDGGGGDEPAPEPEPVVGDV